MANDGLIAFLRARDHPNFSDAWENGARPNGATNTLRPLTHSLDLGKEGLMPNPTQRACSVVGCPADGKLTRGLCPKHYYQWRRDTPPERRGPAPRFTRTFWDFVDTSGDCWTWTGPTTGRQGYGSWSGQGFKGLAHRYALGLLEPCPDPALFACHHCDNPPCVNPNHLYWGTVVDNVRDYAERQGVHNKGTHKTHCLKGHLIAGDNLRIVGADQRHICRICDNERSRAKMARRRAA